MPDDSKELFMRLLVSDKIYDNHLEYTYILVFLLLLVERTLVRLLLGKVVVVLLESSSCTYQNTISYHPLEGL